MIRNILIGVVGVFLTGILLSLAGWLMFNFSDQGELIMALHTGTISKEEFAGTFFEGAERRTLVSEILIFPLIAVSLGSFVGLFARERTWLPALIAISPLFLFLLSVPSIKGVLLCAVYATLAIAIATILSRWRFLRRVDRVEF